MEPVKILLADDHAIVRAGMRNTLEEIPQLKVVAEVGSGPEVFAALKRYPVDCLLIDVTMPAFEPITAIREIRADYPELKILVVSAYDDDVYVRGLLGVGVNGYHLKDQSLNDLKLAVERVLAGERWVSSSLIGKLVGNRELEVHLPTLTRRQRDLLGLLRQGLDNQSIAQEMGLSVKTVENHLTRLYRQLEVQSRLEAMNFVTRFPQVLGAPGQEAAKEKPDYSPGLQKGVGILVVDDNARYRRQLQRMIGRLCPQAVVYEAEGVQDAVQLAQRLELQLILVDVVLGDEDGITCTRRIKTVRPQSRIILMSAYPDREFRRQGLESGAIAFLDKKDLDLRALRQVVEDLLG